MKMIFTLLLIALSLSSFSQNSARLTVTALIHGNITVVVDNRTYQVSSGDRTVMINSINAGNHSIRIYKNSGFRRNSQILFEDRLYLRRGSHLDIVINRFGKVYTDVEQMNTNHGGHGNNQDNQHWNEGNQGMSSSNFSQLKQTLSKESFDNTRITIAKQAISDNKFTSQQTKELVSLFTYENNKLEIAKYLYDYTTDKNNFIIVYDAFTYSSSKEELAEYIQKQ